MPIVMMPDGTQVQMPDNPDPALIGRLKNYLNDYNNRPQVSQAGTAGHAVERQIAPVGGALAAAGAGAELGTMVMPGIGTAAGAILGGVAGGYGAGKLQQKMLEEFPKAAKWLKQNPEQQEAEQQAYPVTQKIAELAPQLAFFRPSLTALKSTAGLSEAAAKEIYTARKLAAVNAGIGGATDVAQQKLEGNKNIDWTSAGESALLGGALSHETALGKKVFGLGERLAGKPATIPTPTSPAAEPLPAASPSSEGVGPATAAPEPAPVAATPEPTPPLSAPQATQVPPPVAATPDVAKPVEPILPGEANTSISPETKASNRQAVKDFLTASGPATAKDIAKEVNLKWNSVVGHLNTMKKTGLVARDGDKWKIVEPAKAEEPANGPEPAKPDGEPARSSAGDVASGPRGSVELPVSQPDTHVPLPFEAERTGVAGHPAAADGHPVAEEATHAPLDYYGATKDYLKNLLYEKSDPQTNKLLALTERAYIKGHIDTHTYDQLQGELKSATPDHDYVANLLKEATRLPEPDEKPVPVKTTTDKKEWLQKQDIQKASGDELLAIAQQAHELGLVDGPTFTKIYAEATNDSGEPNLRKIRNWITGERAVRTTTPVPKASTGATESVEEFMARRAKEAAAEVPKPPSTQAAEPTIESRIAKLAEHFEGPFLNAKSNVVASDKIKPEYRDYLQGLLKQVGLGNVNTFLAHADDLIENPNKYNLGGEHNKIFDYFHRNSFSTMGAFGKDNKDFFIVLRNDAHNSPPGVVVETIAHEVGHMLQRTHFKAADKATRDAIFKDYNQWLRHAQKMDAKELIPYLRNRNIAESEKLNNVSDEKVKTNPYWTSFSEWFADQTSRWATTSDKPLTLVDKFFKSMGQAMRKLASIVTGKTYLPASSMKLFLDKLGPADERAWDGIIKPDMEEMAVTKKAPALEENDINDIERNTSSEQSKLYREQTTKQGFVRTVAQAFKTNSYEAKEEALRLLQNYYRPLTTLQEHLNSSGRDNTDIADKMSRQNSITEMANKEIQPVIRDLHSAIAEFSHKIGKSMDDTLKRLQTYVVARHEPERRMERWLQDVPLQDKPGTEITLKDVNGNPIKGTPADIRKALDEKYKTSAPGAAEQAHDRQIKEYLAKNHADKDGFSPVKSSSKPRSMSIDINHKVYNVAGEVYTPKAKQIIQDTHTEDMKKYGPEIDKMFSLAKNLQDLEAKYSRMSGFRSDKVDSIIGLYDWKHYMPLKGDPGARKNQERFNLTGDKGVSGDMNQSPRAMGGRQTVSDNSFMQVIADASKAATRYGKDGITAEAARLIDAGHIAGKKMTQKPISFADREAELEKASYYGPNKFFVHHPDGSIDVYKINDRKIAEALKGFVGDPGGFWRGLNWINSTIGQFHTRWNPAFPPYNFVRHMITSSGFVGAEEGPLQGLKFAGKVAATILNGGMYKAMKAARLYHASDLKGLDDLAAKDDFYKGIKEYLVNGGRATYTQSLNIVRAQKDLAKIVNPKGFMTSVEHVRKYFDIWSDMFEFAGRSAGYGAIKEHMLSKGMGEQEAQLKASQYTKKLFDYSQVGKYGREAGSLFMFLRPAMTTAARALDAIGPAFGDVDKAVARLPRSVTDVDLITKKTVIPEFTANGANLKDPAVKEQIKARAQQLSDQYKDTYKQNYLARQKNARIMATGMMGAGYLLYTMSMLAGEQDDLGRNKVATDNMELWTRNIRLPAHGMLGKGNDYFQIPWGWGLGAFGSFGAQIAGATLGESTLGEAIANSIPTALESYLPIPTPKYSPIEHPLAFAISSVTPSFVRPFIEYGFNVDEFGREIYKDRMNQFGDAYSGGENLPELYGATARMMADATNGSISIYPNTLHFFANSYLDGLARLMTNTYGTGLTLAGQKDFDPKSDLGGIADSFIGKSSSFDSREYQDFKAKIQHSQGILKMYADHPEQYDRYVEAHPNAEMIDSLYNSLENGALKQIREQLNNLRDDTNQSPKDKADQIKDLRLQRDMLIRNFLDEVKDYE